jgi:hypothetical protein
MPDGPDELDKCERDEVLDAWRRTERERLAV